MFAFSQVCEGDVLNSREHFWPLSKHMGGQRRQRMKTKLVSGNRRWAMLAMIFTIALPYSSPVVRKIISLWLERRIVLRDFTETSVDERGPVAWWAQG